MQLIQGRNAFQHAVLDPGHRVPHRWFYGSGADFAHDQAEPGLDRRKQVIPVPDGNAHRQTGKPWIRMRYKVAVNSNLRGRGAIGAGADDRDFGWDSRAIHRGYFYQTNPYFVCTATYIKSTYSSSTAMDQRWQRPARGGAAAQGIRLGHRQGFFESHRGPPPENHSTALRGQKRTPEPGRQDFYRLPAQRPGLTTVCAWSAPAPAWASRFQWNGANWPRCAAATTGPYAAYIPGWTSATTRGNAMARRHLV